MKNETGEKEHVLIVEDDDSFCTLLAEEIDDAGFEVRTAKTAEEARSVVAGWLPDLVLCDLRLPGGDGLELLCLTRTLTAPPAFILITAFGTVPQAVEALKAGADDFLTKPLDLEHLLLRIMRTLELRRLRQEMKRFREQFEGGHFHGMVGQSEAMGGLFRQIRQVARAAGPVLIIGESGGTDRSACGASANPRSSAYPRRTGESLHPLRAGAGRRQQAPRRRPARHRPPHAVPAPRRGRAFGIGVNPTASAHKKR